MAADDKIIIQFDGDIKALKAKLSDSKREVSKLSIVAKKLGSGLASAGKLAGVAFGALAAAVTATVNEARKFEEITTQFEVLTGSAKQATQTVKELQQFSATTPFQFEGISQAAQQLLGFGFSAEELIPKLREIGDVASAVGRPIEEVGFIFGQVAAAGKLTGERLLQFQERAIPIGPAIAKTMGIAENAVKEAVSRGEVDLETFQKAFASLSQQGGFAFEGMIKQSKTLSGLISTTKDNFSLFAANIGQRLLPVAKLLATRFLAFLQRLNETNTVVDIFAGTIQRLFNIGLRVKAAFDALRTVLGGGLATAIEAASAAIKLNFAQAATIAKEGTKELNADLVRIDAQLKQDLLDADKAFQEAKQEQQVSASEMEKEKLKEDLAEQTEIKKQARLNEAEILNELEQELAEQKYESEAEKQAIIDDLAQKRLKKTFDAERAVNQEDIKASIKENQLRMKEEIRYGKGLAQAKAFFRSEEVKGTQQMLSSLTQLSASGNKDLVRISKVASIAQAIMNTAEGVTQALTLPFPLNFATAAAVAAAGAVQIGTIRSTGFAKGGIAEGGMMGVDSIPAMLQSGEIVAPRSNFEDVIGSVRALREAERIREETGLGGGATEIMISFKDDIGEFIDATILERRQLGIGSL